MCRFYGLNDPEYEKVAGCLQEILKEIRDPTLSTLHESSPPTQTQTVHVTLEEYSFVNAHDSLPTKPYTQTGNRTRQLTAPLTRPPSVPIVAPAIRARNERSARREMLVRSLKFDRLGARSLNIEDTYGDTCQWFLSKQEYLDWQKPGRHSPSSWFLWIKGKPGTGKSTLMKYLHSTRQPEGSTSIVLSFFFNARGTQLEHTTLGCYRGLLFALLHDRKELGPP